MWQPGSKLVHPFNPDWGTGVVRQVDGRFLLVWFPAVEEELTLAADGAGLTRLVMPPGAQAQLIETGEQVEVAEVRGHRYRLTDGREVDDEALWPLAPADTPVERLATLRLDDLDHFRNRLDALRLSELREAGGLGSFLGGRIELFPHQLHTALRAVQADPVRWLLADEVGLGKTVEACLILSALVRTGRAERALVVAPSTLAIQWLGELYRKFHQVFVLLDPERVEAVATTVGPDANPFEVHPQAVIPLEWLAADAELRRLAEEAAPDLVVLDEAHRLATPEQHEALAPLVAGARHALLLTATPLQQDREGFFRLLSLLHPKAFASFEAFEKGLEKGEAAIPCTSAVRRADVGGLPPRVPTAVDLPPAADEPRRDPRARWIAEQARTWAAAGEKALVFVHDLERLQALKPFLESETGTRVATFHEDMSTATRDIEVAAFRETALPLLLSSDAGSEGRNFQFCDRLVLYDLPHDPVVLEQRIGRLDRIGRTKPVELFYFRCEGDAPDVARLYERLDLFGRPAAGLDVALAQVAGALAAGKDVDVEALATSLEKERAQASRDVARVYYRDGYDAERDAGVLDLVPPELEALNRRVCVEAAEGLNLDVVEKGGEALYYVELGSGATVDGLPGVPGGTRYYGTFDRAEAVRRDELEFFASGHPLVEGLLLELEDGPRGRACLAEVFTGELGEAAGLLALYKDGPAWHARVVDAAGKPRPEWVAPLLGALPEARPGKARKWGIGRGWAEGVRALSESLQGPGRLVAACFFRNLP